MKKKLYWLLLLIVPVVFVAASMPEPNAVGDDTNECSTSGTDQKPYNGEQGCPYTFDFSDFVYCTLDDVDLDKNTPVVEHYLNKETCEVWYVGNGKVEMIPKEGFGGEGFIVTLDVRVYFDDNNNPSEVEWWTCEVTHGDPPFPPPCY